MINLRSCIFEKLNKKQNLILIIKVAFKAWRFHDLIKMHVRIYHSIIKKTMNDNYVHPTPSKTIK